MDRNEIIGDAASTIGYNGETTDEGLREVSGLSNILPSIHFDNFTCDMP